MQEDRCLVADFANLQKCNGINVITMKGVRQTFCLCHNSEVMNGSPYLLLLNLTRNMTWKQFVNVEQRNHYAVSDCLDVTAGMGQILPHVHDPVHVFCGPAHRTFGDGSYVPENRISNLGPKIKLDIARRV